MAHFSAVDVWTTTKTYIAPTALLLPLLLSFSRRLTVRGRAILAVSHLSQSRAELVVVLQGRGRSAREMWDSISNF